MQKRTYALLIIGVISLSPSAFAAEKTDPMVGTFGRIGSTQIQLTINDDFTFSYQDYSSNENNGSIDGTWAFRRGKVVLTATCTEKKFHQVWKITNRGQTAKSRKGLSFFRLCKSGE